MNYFHVLENEKWCWAKTTQVGQKPHGTLSTYLGCVGSPDKTTPWSLSIPFVSSQPLATELITPEFRTSLAFPSFPIVAPSSPLTIPSLARFL